MAVWTSIRLGQPGVVRLFWRADRNGVLGNYPDCLPESASTPGNERPPHSFRSDIMGSIRAALRAGT
jgi:hypothetical protein